MYCYRGTCTDQAGNRLSGWFVECVLSGVVQSIFADNSGTPIVSVSGVANRAKTDPRGNFYFFVGDGIFDLNYYDSAGVFQFQETHFTMQSYGLNAASFPTTRAALAALPNDTNAYLLESGREGWFSWSSANLSAQVALDTQQGLYIAPSSAPTGASGAWVRQVPDKVYQASWFGTSTGRTDNQVCYNTAWEVLPDGATLIIPPYTHTASAPIIFKPGKAIHLRGADPIASHIQANAATLANFIGNQHLTLVHMLGSKSTAKDFALTGPVNNVPSGEPAALTLGKLTYNPVGGPAYGIVEDMLADNITIFGGSAGIRVCPYFVAKAGAPTGLGSNNWTHYDVNYRPVVRNCVITVDRAGIEYYGVIDARDENNSITLNHVADTSVFCAGVRVLGCIGVISTGLKVSYAQEHQGNTNRYGIFIANAGFNDDKWRPSNVGVVVNDTRIVNAVQGIGLMTNSTDGDIVVDGAILDNPIDSTATQTVALVCDIYTVEAAKTKRCVVRNVNARGQCSLLRYEMPTAHLQLQDIDWVQNTVTADTSTPVFRIFDQGTFSGTVGGFGIIEIERVKMRSKRVTYGEITLGGMVATSKVIANQNWTAPDGGPAFAQFIRTGTSAVGAKLITDGVTEQEMSGAVAFTSGLNYRFPTGSRDLTA